MATDSRELVDYYTQEGCPFLALALEQRYGYPLAVLFDVGREDDWGSGLEDVPVHCFVWAPDGQALDAHGRRSIEQLRADFPDLQEARVYELTRQELLALCGERRPFYSASAQELASAGATIVRLELE